MILADDAGDSFILATRSWLAKAVIGLGLCPFAAKAYVRGQVRFVVSDARWEPDLIKDFVHEALLLQQTSADLCETTLLIHPHVLANFADYNEFLAVADETLLQLGLEGELQVASFHPQYQFAGTAADSIENFTNRAPQPMLHLLRESSVTHAVDTFAGIDEIGDRNVATLRALGHEGWKRLWASS